MCGTRLPRSSWIMLSMVVLAFAAGTGFGVLGWPACNGNCTPISDAVLMMDSSRASSPDSDTSFAPDRGTGPVGADQSLASADATAPVAPAAPVIDGPQWSEQDPDSERHSSDLNALDGGRTGGPRPPPFSRSLASLTDAAVPVRIGSEPPSPTVYVQADSVADAGSVVDDHDRDMEEKSAALSRLMAEIMDALGPVRQGQSPDRRTATQLCRQLARYTASRPPVAEFDPPLRLSELDVFLDTIRAVLEAETKRAAALLRSVTAVEKTDPFQEGEAVPVADFQQLRDLRHFHAALCRLLNANDLLTPLLAAVASSIGRRMRLSLEESVALFAVKDADTDTVLAALRFWIVHTRAMFGGDERGPVRHVLAMARAEMQLRTDWLYLEPEYKDRVRVDKGRYDGYVPVLGMFTGTTRGRLPSGGGRTLSRAHHRVLQRLDDVLARHATRLTRFTQSRLRQVRNVHAAALSAKTAIEKIAARLNAWPESEIDATLAESYVTWQIPSADLPESISELIEADVRAFGLLMKECGIVGRLVQPGSAKVTVSDLAEVAADLSALYESCSASLLTDLQLLEQKYNLRGCNLHEIKESVNIDRICARRVPKDLRDPVRTLVRTLPALPVSWEAPITSMAVRLGLNLSS